MLRTDKTNVTETKDIQFDINCFLLRSKLPRLLSNYKKEKSRIRETKHLSTDADSSIDTTVGWTKNTQKPIFFEKRKKSSKMQKLKNI